MKNLKTFTEFLNENYGQLNEDITDPKIEKFISKNLEDAYIGHKSDDGYTSSSHDYRIHLWLGKEVENEMHMHNVMQRKSRNVKAITSYIEKNYRGCTSGTDAYSMDSPNHSGNLQQQGRCLALYAKTKENVIDMINDFIMPFNKDLANKLLKQI